MSSKIDIAAIWQQISTDLSLPLVQILTKEWVVVVFVGVIVMGFVYGLIKAIFTIGRVKHEVSKAVQVLNALGSEKQHEVFYRQFEDINQKISGIKVLSHAWHEFVESMFFAEPNAGHSKVYLSHRPAYSLFP